MQGRVKWFDYAKGYGLVTPLDGSQDAFIHHSELSQTDLQSLCEGDAVEFEIVRGKLGPTAVNVQRTSAGAAGSLAIDSDVTANAGPPARASGDVLTFLSQSQRIVLGVDNMSAEQKQTLLSWGIHMYGLGQHRVAHIDTIKYDGRLVVLDDGSRWEVDASDHMTASIWSEFERVVVIEGQMFLLDENESIHVEEELE